MSYNGTICSCIGVAFLLVALAGSQSGRVRGDTVASLLLNAIGGALATIGAGLDGIIPFAILNGIWALLSSFNAARILISRSCSKGAEAHPNVEAPTESSKI